MIVRVRAPPSSRRNCLFQHWLIRSASSYGIRVNRPAGERTSEWTFELIDHKLQVGHSWTYSIRFDLYTRYRYSKLLAALSESSLRLVSDETSEPADITDPSETRSGPKEYPKQEQQIRST